MKRDPVKLRAWQRRSKERAFKKRVRQGFRHSERKIEKEQRPRKPLKKISKNQRHEHSIYRASFREWVAKPENARCAVCIILRAAGEIATINPTTERHHFRGRHHKLLNWEPGWIPCCRAHREWPHDPANRARAEENDIIASRTDFNTYPPELRTP